MSVAHITKIGIKKSIENNIENLLFSYIKWYVLAFNGMLSVFISKRLQEMKSPWKVTKLIKEKGYLHEK